MVVINRTISVNGQNNRKAIPMHTIAVNNERNVGIWQTINYYILYLKIPIFYLLFLLFVFDFDSIAVQKLIIDNKINKNIDVIVAITLKLAKYA